MTNDKFVFCEGVNDQAVIEAIVAFLKLDVKVETFGGKDNLRNFLRNLATRPEFAQKRVKSVAVIRDADENPTAAFSSVRDALRNNGFAAPFANQQIQEGQLRCGILILPLDRPGMIEDLCLESVSNEPEFRCVQDYFTCIETNSKRTGFTSKHKMHVWMGSHSKSYFRKFTGEAVTAGLFPMDHASFEPLRAFLQKL